MSRSWLRSVAYQPVATAPRDLPPLEYGVDEELLASNGGEALGGRVLLLWRDDDTDEFVEACLAPTPWHAFAVCCLRPLVSRCLSHTGTNALLGTGQMFVLSTEQARRLLAPPDAPTRRATMEAAGSVRLGRLLDVGAGDGGVTARMAPLFDEVRATEVCPRMVRAIRRRGIACTECGDLDALPAGVRGAGFDVVACLNVLDRCDRPRTLLRQLRSLLRPGSGRLLVATPVPFNPWVEKGRTWVRPAEHVALRGDMLDSYEFSYYGLGFEQSARLLATHLFAPAGLAVVSVSRAPYLSQGDTGVPYYVLDDAIFVLEAAAEAE